MTAFWDSAALVEDLASAGSGGLNAAYFTHRARAGTGPRRLAAAVLALLCGGAALQAAQHLVVAGPGAAEVLARVPLLAANLAVSSARCRRRATPRGRPRCVGHAPRPGGPPMTALAAAVAREQYELAALRLLLGVVATLDRMAPPAREQLLALLTPERP